MFLKIKKNFLENKEILIFSMITVLFWGILCHGFAFSNELISHDSMNEFDASILGNVWKIQLGRVFSPIYKILTRGSLTSTWVIGFLSLLYLGLSLFILLKVFSLKNKFYIFLIGGILVTNITVTSLVATYIHDLDSNMLALFYSIVAVYFWRKNNKKYIFYGAIFLCLAIGLYQSYISVTIVLIIFKLLLDLFYGNKFKIIFKKGSLGIVMIIIGGILYTIASKIIYYLSGISMVEGAYNSGNTFLYMKLLDIIKQAFIAYLIVIYEFFMSIKSYNIMLSILLNLIIGVVLIYILILFFKNKENAKIEKLIFILLFLLLPLSMNICRILTNGMSHELMYFAIWLSYIFPFIIFEKLNLKKNKFYNKVKIVVTIVISIILWNNFITANNFYVKKYLERDATISFMNRVISDIEEIEGYEYAKTKVALVGVIKDQISTNINYGRYKELYSYDDMIAVGFYKTFFDYIMHYKLLLVDNNELQKLENKDIVKKMPLYPNKGSIEVIDNTIVVKFSNYEKNERRLEKFKKKLKNYLRKSKEYF